MVLSPPKFGGSVRPMKRRFEQMMSVHNLSPTLPLLKLARTSMIYERFKNKSKMEQREEEPWKCFVLKDPSRHSYWKIREYWVERPLKIVDFSDKQERCSEEYQAYATTNHYDGYRRGEQIWLLNPPLRLVDDDKQPKRSQAFIS